MPLLNRITGQLNGAGKMIEEGRYCPDILNQLRAARAALRTLEGRILEEHLRCCVGQAFNSGEKKEKEGKVAELLDLFRRYDNDAQG
ncbi:MAG: metal-sensitive transcriptional regulator [Blastochloris viridis]|uniref:Metal-sensitive transcriptional regulator n=1 Tax=Blastochloris viridis TaxID=1079 RepID=A0A6N4REG6_BLAVI|nr:MAG: metal-sensitive transcriptional regulator [Blastochloris viridis]